MLGRGTTIEAVIQLVLELHDHVNKSFSVWSVNVGYPDFLAPDMQKTFHVFLPYLGVLLHLLGFVDGGFKMDCSDGIIKSGDYCFR